VIERMTDEEFARFEQVPPIDWAQPEAEELLIAETKRARSAEADLERKHAALVDAVRQLYGFIGVASPALPLQRFLDQSREAWVAIAAAMPEEKP
jgi:hypothetical protein